MIGPSLPPNSRPREVPPEIDRWNWGAFWFTCFWGIFNRTPIALLAILPGFNVVMPFVLGARGSRWAWRELGQRRAFQTGSTQMGSMGMR